MMFLTFDVETAGLYGEAFALGWVLTRSDGEVVREGLQTCPLSSIEPDDDDITESLAWLQLNVVPHLPVKPTCRTPFGVRQAFLFAWEAAKVEAKATNNRLYLAADVAFPCETRFLSDCRRDDPYTWKRLGSPYPLVDVSSVILAMGCDPVGTYAREENERPAHNPLMDARQSSRLLHTALQGITKQL